MIITVKASEYIQAIVDKINNAINKILDIYATQLPDNVFYTLQILISVIVFVMLFVMARRFRRLKQEPITMLLLLVWGICGLGCITNILAVVLCIVLSNR